MVLLAFLAALSCGTATVRHLPTDLYGTWRASGVETHAQIRRNVGRANPRAIAVVEGMNWMIVFRPNGSYATTLTLKGRRGTQKGVFTLSKGANGTVQAFIQERTGRRTFRLANNRLILVRGGNDIVFLRHAGH